MDLRIALLGPVRAWTARGEVPLGPARQRALLAVLASRHGVQVSRGELVDAIWGEHAPVSAAGSVHTYVSSLRSALEPGRRRGEPARHLLSEGSGYRLHFDVDDLDVTRFQRLRDLTRQRKEQQDVAGALAAAEAALALWRGEALQGVPGPFAAHQRARLTDLRLDVTERRAELMLALGREHEIAAELDALTRLHPLRERLCGLSMRALLLVGDRTGALACFEDLREAMLDALGIEPSPELATLHQRILGGEPVLVGRDAEVAAVHAAVTRARFGNGGVVLLEGAAGIGKTAVLTTALRDTTGCEVVWEACHETDTARTFTTLSSVVDGCLADAGTVPIVLVLDDLQWADSVRTTVLRALEERASRLPLLIIAACRTGVDSTARTELVRAGAEVIRLEELPDGLALVTALTGGTVDLDLLCLARLAAGHPQYLRDVVEHFGSADLVDVVVHRLGHLPSDVVDALRRASLLGETFSEAEIAALMRRPAGWTTAVVRLAVAAGVLAERDDGLAFRHPLVRLALAESHPVALHSALRRESVQ